MLYSNWTTWIKHHYKKQGSGGMCCFGYCWEDKIQCRKWLTDSLIWLASIVCCRMSQCIKACLCISFFAWAPCVVTPPPICQHHLEKRGAVVSLNTVLRTKTCGWNLVSSWDHVKLTILTRSLQIQILLKWLNNTWLHEAGHWLILQRATHSLNIFLRVVCL